MIRYWSQRRPVNRQTRQAFTKRVILNQLEWRENVKRRQCTGGKAHRRLRVWQDLPSNHYCTLFTRYLCCYLIMTKDIGPSITSRMPPATVREKASVRERAVGGKNILGDCEMRDGGDTCMITFCSVPVPSRSYGQSALRGDGDVLESQVHGGRC